jgi:hypothetical protein
MSEDRRPKRRCVTRKTLVPSAAHYVGYVEEDETPEMIMKKFEALEKVMQAHGKQDGDAMDNKENEDAAADAGAGPSKAPEAPPAPGEMELDETQLVEVFKQTSIFNVRSALANNTVLMAGDHNAERPGERGDPNDSDGVLSSDEGGQMDYLRGFWSDEEFLGAAAGDRGGAQGKERRRRGPRGPRDPAARLRAAQKRSDKCHALITQYNKDTNALIRRRVRVVDPDAILQIRVPPPPVPPSWGRAVRPFVPRAARLAAAQAAAAAPEPAGRASSYSAPDVCGFDFSQLPSSSYQAVLINTGWEREQQQQQEAAAPGAAPGPGSAASSVVERLRRLPIQRLCPTGFVFVWAEKHHLHAVCKQLHSWGYAYVENLTWVLMAPNNSILRLGHAYTCKSHLTLLIFRKEGARPGPACCCCWCRLRPALPAGWLHAGCRLAGRRSSCSRAARLCRRAGRLALPLPCPFTHLQPPPTPCRRGQGHRAAPPAQPRRHLRLHHLRRGWASQPCPPACPPAWSACLAACLPAVDPGSAAPRGAALYRSRACCSAGAGCRFQPACLPAQASRRRGCCLLRCRARVVGAGAGDRQHRDDAAHRQGRLPGAVGRQGRGAPRLDARGGGLLGGAGQGAGGWAYAAGVWSERAAATRSCHGGWEIQSAECL